MDSTLTRTLISLVVVLVAIMTILLFAVRHANRQIPGLQAWAYSYLCGLLLAITMLAKPHAPEWLPPVVGPVLTVLSSWLNLAAARAYTGRAPWPRAYLAGTLVIMLGGTIHLYSLQPDPTLRLALVFGVSGTLMLLSAHAMFTTGIRLAPERYLFTLACGAQGLSVLAASLALLQGNADLSGSEHFRTVFHHVLLASIVVLVTRAFGVLMLANAHITTELRHFAEHDPLTGIYNRRSFGILLDKSIRLMRRMNSPLSLLALDLDHFKRINDSWGHGVGDQALRHFVRLASEHLRHEDVIGRMGGEEFVILLPNTGLEAASGVAERLRALIEAQPLAGPRGPIVLTVSIGVTLVARDEAQDSALERVDEAMYQAKSNGRNRVERARPYLPMQNDEKITPSRSSELKAPVI